MHHLPRFFIHSKKPAPMDPKNRRRPRLERRNAAKHIEYDATPSCSSTDKSPSSFLVTRSLDLPDRTSFRVEGRDGEFDQIFRSLGLSGPEDFAIPAAAWEAMKVRSASDLLPRSRFHDMESPRIDEAVPLSRFHDMDSPRIDEAVPLSRFHDMDSPTIDEAEQHHNDCRRQEKEQEERGARVLDSVTITTELIKDEPVETVNLSVRSGAASGAAGGGIKGVRPPSLKPPPSMTLPVIDNACSTWDLLRDFAPENDKRSLGMTHRDFSSDDEEGLGGVTADKRDVEETLLRRIGDTALLSESCSFTTSNDDDSSSTTTEPMSNISPNGRFRRIITYWEKGELLGRGSFGSVYEGISDDGFFFAVKVVSLLDQGSQGKQSIYQLEQEISLLSQFEHENIVQYYGTDTDESKLYIFLELVTKGSLMSLYQRYNLRDSQVSSYTRQILHGLKYLHDRNVVHRDIKCANILVDANGSVKLADFGLAKATKLNDVKSCKGTAFWMAPEVVNRKNQGYGLPADIWSLGCTVLEMLTRQIPYSDLECMQALFKIGRGVPPRVPDYLSEDARDFILKCLHVHPGDRPTAAQLLEHSFVRRSLSVSSGFASPYLARRS